VSLSMRPNLRLPWPDALLAAGCNDASGFWMNRIQQRVSPGRASLPQGCPTLLDAIPGPERAEAAAQKPKAKSQKGHHATMPSAQSGPHLDAATILHRCMMHPKADWRVSSLRDGLCKERLERGV
jgi:hypothetical protein